MGIEESLNGLNDTLKKLIEVNEATLAALKGGAAKAGGTSTKAGATKATDEKKTATRKTSTRTKKITLTNVTDKFGEYLSVEDEDERAERRANVRKIVDHFGVAKASALDESDYAEAIKMLDTYEAGDEPDFGGEDEAEDEDGALV